MITTHSLAPAEWAEVSNHPLQSQIVLLSTHLCSLIAVTSLQTPRLILRQAEIYLQDLATLQATPSSQLEAREQHYLLIATFNALVHFLEQVIGYHRPPSATHRWATTIEEQIPHHNLRALSAEVALHQHEKMVENLYLGSYWSRYYFDQIAQWRNIGGSLPPMLTLLSPLFEKSTPAQMSSFKQKMETYIQQALVLALRLF